MELTVVLPALRGIESVGAAMDAWAGQTGRERIEILIVGPGQPGAGETLPAGQRWISTGSADLHEARAMGVGQAAGAYVTLAEDHCLPEPGWVEAMLARMAGGWDVIAPAMLPGNLGCAAGRGSFLLGYGEWMHPVAGGPVRVVGGWNGTIRTALLRDLGERLAEELLMGAILIQRLRAEGHRFYLEERALMRHYDASGWGHQFGLFMLVGLGFGAVRTSRWPLAGRLLYVLAMPAVAVLHARRAIVHYCRAGAAAGLRPPVLVAAMWLALAWAIGEAAGAAFGPARVSGYLSLPEIKPVRREQLVPR